MSKLDKTFAAELQKSPSKGGWTYVSCQGPLNTSGPAGW
jgi:hypothetical protein